MYSAPPRRVLVATDLSEGAEDAVGRAAELAALHGAHLRALCVVPPDADPELVEFARSRLRSRTAWHAGTAAGTAVRRGRTVTAILDEVRGSGADLLVVGAHGTHRTAGALLGGTPANLVRASEVPVLIVRRRPGAAYRRVLLAVDGGERSLGTARAGTGLTPGAEHLVVHVTAVPGEPPPLQQGADEAGPGRLRHTAVEQARPGVERIAAALTPPSSVLVVPGHPQTAVPELADRERADLAVVGTGTHSRFGYALLGGVARHVVSRAPCDVLVVPDRDGTADHHPAP